jgi:hypothetical protein
MHLPSKTILLLVASLVEALSRLSGEHKAVYIMTNTAENAVIGLPVNSDGCLGEGHVTLTGGHGGNALTGSPQQPSGPDALFSQAPITVAGEVRMR